MIANWGEKKYIPNKTSAQEGGKMSETTISRMLGAGIILVTGVMLFNYYRTAKTAEREKTSSTTTEATQETTEESTTLADLPASYEVKSGDSLWKIAEKVYGSGYNWTDIYAANKTVISNPNRLLVGTRLTLPKVETKIISHSVVRGETLWSVAQSYCGSGFAWEALAKANNISEPTKLEIGTQLSIACK